MKKIVILYLGMLISLASSGQIFTFTFSGTGACPTQGNQVNPANAVVSSFSRVGVNCSTSGGYFSSSGWSQSSTIDQNQFIEVTITADAGYKLNLTGVSFSIVSSGTGPTDARISHNGSGTFTTYADFNINSNPTYYWDFTDFSSADAGSCTFRIYGWGASSSAGTMKITNFSANGSISSVSSGSSSQWISTGNDINYSTGNVSIGGITSPLSKLHVDGNIFSNGKIFIGASDSNTVNLISNYKLVVDGAALFTKAVIKERIHWPDYVFHADYLLTPLDSLEQFIKLNKHLPEMPTASDVEGNGLDLGATQALLLKKIEELTLIVIEQNKRIKELEKKKEN